MSDPRMETVKALQDTVLDILTRVEEDRLEATELLRQDHKLLVRHLKGHQRSGCLVCEFLDRRS